MGIGNSIPSISKTTNDTGGGGGISSDVSQKLSSAATIVESSERQSCPLSVDSSQSLDEETRLATDIGSAAHGARCLDNKTMNTFKDNRSRRKTEATTSWSRESSVMDPSITIAQLAAANHQLASAHNLALEHCRSLIVANVQGGDFYKRALLCPNCCNKDNIAPVRAKRIIEASPANKKLKKSKRKKVKYSEAAESIPAYEEVNLKEEIEKLNSSKLESQKLNGELEREVEQQRTLIDRLMRDIEDLKKESEKREKSLELAKDKLSRSELESASLLDRLETFQSERKAEEAEERRKHLQALDEATQQIRNLELVISNKQQQESKSTTTTVEPSTSTSSSSNEDLQSFKKDLLLKREARQRAIAGISSEMERLRSELESEKLAHEETARLLRESLKDDGTTSGSTTKNMFSEEYVEALRLLDLLKISDEVSLSLRLQLERTDDLRFSLESEPEENQQRIRSLHRLTEEIRSNLQDRNRHVASLKDRLAHLLARLDESRRLQLNSDDEIRREAERQLKDIARSRQLCDERSRIIAEMKDQLRLKLASLGQDNQSLEEEIRKNEDKIDAQDTDISNLESQLGLAKADCRELQNQVSLINSLFSQMLLGASSAEMDLDRLTRLLQENHDLITGMAKEKGTEATALPKLLLDLIEQVDGREASCVDERKEEGELQEDSIAHNLPKVWRILLELLSCQASATASTTCEEGTNASTESSPDSCYKSVDTPTGPRLVISVSKTYIRLKELILEKKHLEKEMNKMKKLNCHLESKLSEQEKRLSTVSDELSKTWNIVGRMQAQHQQLHTHEKILRYELQQKRKMLQELKQELEYCREKWESARQKNTNTEIQWKSLRREFAARKALVSHDSVFSNSGESGFSDDREEEESDDDERDVNKRVRPLSSTRRRSKKDGARLMSPETESENQATDTEFSESKITSPSITSGQQTPAPEAEEVPELSEEVVESEVAVVSSSSPKTEENSESGQSLTQTLDKALAKVIENLIESDECNNGQIITSDSEDPNVESTKVESEQIESVPEQDANKEESDSENRRPLTPIFSIGPTPAAQIATNTDSIAGTSSISSDNGKETQFGPSTRASPNEDANAEQKPSPIDARAARLKSLEEQAQWLVKKVNDTNRRGSALNSRLEELHEAYGAAPAAPPMPDVLPAFRLRSELTVETTASRDDDNDETQGNDGRDSTCDDH